MDRRTGSECGSKYGTHTVRTVRTVRSTYGRSVDLGLDCVGVWLCWFVPCIMAPCMQCHVMSCPVLSCNPRPVHPASFFVLESTAFLFCGYDGNRLEGRGRLG